MLARYKESEIGDTGIAAIRCNLYERVIYRCVIGSQAYGLAGEGSDIDRRGIYLPPADLHWSLYGVPDQLENDDTQEAYWEIQKFLVLALKANPNVLECLYTPMVEKATPLAEKLLAMRACFLSRMVYQTYNGYVLSQFKKMQADLRNQGQVKWKHVMHLIRLLLSGIRSCARASCRSGSRSIGTSCWPSGGARCRGKKSRTGGSACTTNSTPPRRRRSLPERPDYEKANALLIEARRAALTEDLP